MFGLDKCGEDYKFYFIFRYKYFKIGVFEEKYVKFLDVDFKKFFIDRKIYFYIFVMNLDDIFEVLVD